jgi:hypothetical protein
MTHNHNTTKTKYALQSDLEAISFAQLMNVALNENIHVDHLPDNLPARTEV